MAKGNVLILGYENFGSIARLAPIITEKGYSCIAVVNKGCSYDYSKLCDSTIFVSNIFDPHLATDEILKQIPPSQIFGIINQLDLLSFTFAILVDSCPNSRHTPIEPIIRCRIKGHLRECLKDDPSFSIDFRVIRNIEELDKTNWTSFPCIAKPVAGAGSQMVRRCFSKKNLSEIIPEIKQHLKTTMPGIERFDKPIDGKKYSLVDDILVEEYVAGPEFTVDGFVYKGDVHVMMLQDIFETDDKEDFLDISFINPPIRLNESGIEEIHNMMKKTLKRLRYDNAYFHAEVKYTVNGPKVVEINPRLAGGLTPMIFGMATGINAYELFIDLSLGHPLNDNVFKLVEHPKREHPYIGCYTFFAPHPGKVVAIHGLEKVKKMDKLLNCTIIVPEGKVVSSIIGKRYLAFVIFGADSPQEMVSLMHKARNTMNFEIERNP